MDLPNITLFFQIGNFCVAYFVLRKYVFTPALTIILVEQSRIDGLHKKIDATRHEQQTLVAEQKTRWNLMKESLRKMIPSKSLQTCLIDQTLPESLKMHDIKLSEQQKESLQNMLQEELSDIKL